MKSKRAKEKLNTLLKKQEQGFFFFREDVVCDAIIFAEQDAEERAVRILEDFIAEGLLLTKEDEIVSKFKLLLNGGQSDE